MEEFLSTYGYLALVVGTFLEGETAILVASSLVHAGIFSGPETVFFGFLGSFASDWLYYIIGRLNGEYFLERRPAWKAKLKPAQEFFFHHRVQILFSYRFLYGFRILLPVLIGLSGVRTLQYLGYSLAAGLAWATIVSCMGYLVGMFLELTPTLIEANIGFVILAAASIGLLGGLAMKRFAERRMGIPGQPG